jgi:hypothetical protein
MPWRTQRRDAVVLSTGERLAFRRIETAPDPRRDAVSERILKAVLTDAATAADRSRSMRRAGFRVIGEEPGRIHLPAGRVLPHSGSPSHARGPRRGWSSPADWVPCPLADVSGAIRPDMSVPLRAKRRVRSCSQSGPPCRRSGTCRSRRTLARISVLARCRQATDRRVATSRRDRRTPGSWPLSQRQAPWSGLQFRRWIGLLRHRRSKREGPAHAGPSPFWIAGVVVLRCHGRARRPRR